jgi:hypothetical protein
MNYNQILTIALASVPTMRAVLIGILLNNARLRDVNSRLGEFRSPIPVSMTSTGASKT